MTHRYITAQYIATKLDVTLNSFYYIKKKGSYCGVDLPKISRRRGWMVVYDRSETEAFIDQVRKFKATHMDIFQVSEYMSASTSTLNRSRATGSLFGVALTKPVLQDNKLWWPREAVIQCRNAIEEVREVI